MAMPRRGRPGPEHSFHWSCRAAGVTISFALLRDAERRVRGDPVAASANASANRGVLWERMEGILSGQLLCSPNVLPAGLDDNASAGLHGDGIGKLDDLW
jgi:hypothetical protein